MEGRKFERNIFCTESRAISYYCYVEETARDGWIGRRGKIGVGGKKRREREDVWGVKESGREGNRREGSMRAMISRCVRLTGPRTALKLLLIYPIRRKDEKEAVNINCPIFLRFVRKRERERMYASTHARATFLLHLHLVTSRDANESENERRKFLRVIIRDCCVAYFQ